MEKIIFLIFFFLSGFQSAKDILNLLLLLYIDLRNNAVRFIQQVKTRGIVFFIYDIM